MLQKHPNKPNENNKLHLTINQEKKLKLIHVKNILYHADIDNWILRRQSLP